MLLLEGLTEFKYELTPFEFGSWDSRVGAITPMEWTGTRLLAGTPVNMSACVRGFDRARFEALNAFSHLLKQIF
jgi:hypothetical protein